MQLLGGFVVLVNGAPITADRWTRRGAAALVKLLALSPDGRLHRDRVVDALWPELTVDVALPRLHKAAHYARGVLGDRDAVVLKGEVIALFPGARLDVDATTFEAAAEDALAVESPDSCAEALKLAGELLPDDLSEPWLEEPRERLRLRVLRLLRGAGRWEDLLALDPANEEAHVELLRESVLAGDRTNGLRRYARMERVLHTELGLAPGPEAVVLRDRLLAVDPGPQPPPVAAPPRDSGRTHLVERDAELAQLGTACELAVDEGRGVVVLVSGEAGAGKSALVRAFLDQLDPAIRVAVGGCDDLLAPRSLGPFRDMAENDAELAAALSGDRPAALLRVFSERSSVVVVEDIHWADDATLDAIRFLARRFPGIPAVLVLTFRDTGIDAGHPLRQLLGSLTGTSVRRVLLPPLTVDAVRRLGAVAPGEAVEIHRVTQGNPFFVTEVLAGGGTGGVKG
ncbi:DNA-binding SARP family transcriptional activator [Kribbella rubisoli]|uniref:DNA-binding SARP family transcriptional activator n=1 Tax=Kribbella rubisoli TaxID=3075929 RepID=A0A4Q7X0V9_9ACTN|nr:DNA-binding SARP family transcriptional activator [Kribbella rubisoli]